MAAEAGPEIEVIIIDGGSGPNATGTITEMLAVTITDRARVRLVSEPDQGIYDAMNKGLRLSTGGHVWFLNGGDECCVSSWQSLRHQLAEHQERMLLADYLLDTGRAQILRHGRNGSYIWHGLPTSHQAIFYPGPRARSCGFDLQYRIVGDYQFTARLIAEGVYTQNWYEPVAVFHAGGVSQANTRLLAREAGQVQREILRIPLPRRLLSQGRHFVSRNLRAFQTRGNVTDPAARVADTLQAGGSTPPKSNSHPQPHESS